MLYFHRVLARPDPFFSDDPTLLQFETLLQRLSSMFDIVTPDDWLQGTLSKDRPSLMISFDDGYKDNLLAAKALERYQARGTFFVSTKAIAAGGSAESLWQNKVLAHYQYLAGVLPVQMLADVRMQCSKSLSKLKYMAPAQIEEACRLMIGRDFSGLEMMDEMDLRAMAKNGHCIGLHTHSHAILTTISDHDVAKELEFSLSVGRKTLPKQRGFFMAYPNGTPGVDFSRRHMSMVQDAGFFGAFGTADGGFQGRDSTDQDKLFALPRFLPYRKNPLLRALSTCRILGESAWENKVPGINNESPQKKIYTQKNKMSQGEL